MSYKMAIIYWVDSTQPLPSWRHIEDAPELKCINCRSMGWIISENDDCVMIASNIGDPDSDNMRASGFMIIPKCSIKQRTVLQ